MTRSNRYRRLFDLRLGGRKRVDDEMDLEIESHLAMRVADLVRDGMTPDAALREARQRFGDFDTARRRLHAAARQREAAMQHRDRIGSVVADLRYAARQARRAPGFTALAVGTLALGIGATTTIFTLVERVLLRALPFPHAEQLFQLSGVDSTHHRAYTVSSADWLDWRHARSLQASALYSFPYRQGIVTTDSATRLSAERVSGAFFAVLGSRFVAGRPFTDDEAQALAPVVVISEAVWRQMYGGDPRLGAPLRTAMRAYTVVGVVASGQEFPAGTDLWFPTAVTLEADRARVNINWELIARLRPGVTADQAQAELGGIARGIRERDPTALYDAGVAAESLADTIIGDVSTYLEMLMATVLVVLLIVCANIAASGLARATARSREMAVRSSLGAARWRLVQQLLIEHLWFAALGGVIGLFLAWIATRGILAMWGNQIPRSGEVSIDARVFGFAVAASLGAGILAGIIPAVRVTRVSLTSTMSVGGRGAAKGGRNFAGSSLASLEIALALLLLTGAGLLIRSFRSVLGRDIGFDTNVATAEVALGGALYAQDTVRRYQYWDALVAAFERIPGVEAVAVSNWIPLGLTGQGFIDVDGREVPGAGAVYRTVSRDFFRALRMPFLAGRTFDERDGLSTQRVVVINQTMASTWWPGESPIGKRVRARSQEPGPNGQPAPWLTIVGVVGDIRTYGLESKVRPEMYVYFRQTPSRTSGMTALVRTRAGRPAGQILNELRRRARGVDARVAIDAGTLDERLRATLATRTLAMSLLSAFAGVALLLAALGIYSVLSYAVAQRTRELAIRAALGAQRRDLMRMVFAAGLRVVVAGLAFGIVAAICLTRALGSMLVGVTAADPLTYSAATAVLLLVALTAIIVPARRATRLDPIIALQVE